MVAVKSTKFLTLNKKTDYMKVSLSTVECAAWNVAHAESIACGVDEAKEPSDQVLAYEKKQAELEEAGFKTAKDMAAAIKIVDANAVISKDGLGQIRQAWVKIEKITTGQHSYIHVGWKMTFQTSQYSYRKDEKTWLKIGNGTRLGLDAKQLVKALAKLAEIEEIIARRQHAGNVAWAAADRLKKFIGENKSFVERMFGYVPSSADKSVAVTVDGTLYVNGDNYTVAQWTAILDLRDAQKAAMVALKNSFKPSPVS